MSTDISIHNPSTAVEMSVQERQQYASVLADANMIPKAFQKNPANIFVAIEYGNALGIAPIVALNEINVINGSPSMSASLMASLARAAGHRVRTQNLEDGSAVCEIIRSDDPEFTHRSVWDEKKAKDAGLWGKGHWAKDPATMLRWRAISECVRMTCPEVLGGLKYTPEEVVEFTGSPAAPMPRTQGSKQSERANTPAASGRDWSAELDDCATAEDVRKLYRECSAARELTKELADAMNAAGTALAATEKEQDDGGVVEATLVDDDGVIQDNAA